MDWIIWYYIGFVTISTIVTYDNDHRFDKTLMPYIFQWFVFNLPAFGRLFGWW